MEEQETKKETPTLRDQFAMAALSAIMAGGNTPKEIAEWAYEIADMMIEVREKNDDRL